MFTITIVFSWFFESLSYDILTCRGSQIEEIKETLASLC